MYNKVEFNMHKVKGTHVNAAHVIGNKHYFLFAGEHQYINFTDAASATPEKSAIPVLVEIHFDPDTANCNNVVNTPTVIREMVDLTAGRPFSSHTPPLSRYTGSKYPQAHFFSKRLGGFILPLRMNYPYSFGYMSIGSFSYMQGVLIS